MLLYFFYKILGPGFILFPYLSYLRICKNINKYLNNERVRKIQCYEYKINVHLLAYFTRKQED